MKIEFSYSGIAFTVEAESAVTVRMAAERGGAPARLAELRKGLSEEAARMWSLEDSAAPVGIAAGAPQLVYAAEMDLLSRLISLRRRLAAEAGVPAYVIFQDRTLKEMEEKRPQSLSALSAIKGVGSIRLEKYGEAFLSCIKEAAA
jgi:ATP-dependent DNA helicase RecQ